MRRSIYRSTPNALGFTIIEIMIVVSILGIILAIAGPTWVRQRTLSQATSCAENLAKINGAKEQWAMDNSKGSEETPTWADLVSAGGTGYLRRQPKCPSSGDYTMGSMGEPATCSVIAPIDHNDIENR